VFERGGFEFCGAGGRTGSSADGRSLLLQDGAHVVWPFAGKASVDKTAGMIRFERDVGTRLCGITSPQPKLAHLGVFSHTLPFWTADKRTEQKRRVRTHPLVNAATGDPVEVDDFDWRAWHARAKALWRTGRNSRPAISLVWAGERTMRVVRNLRTLKERVVIEYRGRWEGNRTRDRLGFDIVDPLVRIVPSGYEHPWLKV
jgi:hypothetical protein